MIEILNDVFATYQEDKKLLQLWLTTNAQAFPDFVLPPFVPPFLVRTMFRTKFRTTSMLGVEAETRTIMEVDSIAAKVATKST